jgi:hypothetical protein
VDKPAVVFVDVDPPDPLAALLPDPLADPLAELLPETLPEPLPAPPTLPVLVPVALALVEDVEGAGAFGVFVCACSRVPPQTTAAHTTPIAIR